MDKKINVNEFYQRVAAHHTLNHDVEAFLTQTAFIEGLLREWFTLLYRLIKREPKSPSLTNLNPIATKLQSFIDKDVSKYTTRRIIELCAKVDALGESTCKKLKTYFEARNNIIHDLIKQYPALKASGELDDAYKLGEEIISQSDLNIMFTTLVETQSLQQKSTLTLPLNVSNTSELAKESQPIEPVHTQTP